jgi:hypothetical protein
LARRAGLDGEDLRALVEAASLAGAVQNVKAHQQVGAPDDTVGRNPSSPVAADLTSETAWLTRVAGAVTGSPLVATALAATGHGRQDSTIRLGTAGNHGGRPSRREPDNEAMNHYTNLHRIQRLDPRQDAHQIYRTMILVDFGGWDALMGLQLAFYSTYGIPTIAGLLDQAGELLARPRKRALDTALLMLELIDHGFAHPQGQRVVQRLRRIHGRYQIANADFLYVLSALMVVPTRWLQRYGWRRVCCHEQAATYWFWRELGQRLGIQHIPPSYHAVEQWFDAYEDEHLRLTDESRRLMQASRALLVGRFPRPLAPLAGALADALLYDRLRGAVGIGAPPWPIRAALDLALRMRARLLGLGLLPARHEPVEAQGRKYGVPYGKIYPYGYTVEQLGPADPADSAGIAADR